MIQLTDCTDEMAYYYANKIAEANKQGLPIDGLESILDKELTRMHDNTRVFLVNSLKERSVSIHKINKLNKLAEKIFRMESGISIGSQVSFVKQGISYFGEVISFETNDGEVIGLFIKVVGCSRPMPLHKRDFNTIEIIK